MVINLEHKVKVRIRKRIVLIYLMIIIGCCLLFFRLGWVKVTSGAAIYERALEQWLRRAPVEARRGNIYDRNGKLIVGSELAPSVVAIPKQVKDVDNTAKVLADILNVKPSLIKSHLQKNVSVEILKPEGRKITIEQAERIAKSRLDGIYLVGDTVRSYPYQHYLAQVIGITGIDNQGITGLEYIYDDYLRGQSGAVNVFTDAHGNVIPNLSGNYYSPTAGFDLYLTIDLDIQISLERVLDNAMARYNPDEIIALVMDPMTSEILAMASRPTFNPSRYQDYDQAIYNRNLPIWKSYEPGSTFKVVTYAAGLEEKLFSLDENFFDPGYAVVDGARIRDWKAGGHGKQTFLQVIQNSCNPGFVEIGLRLGKTRFFDYLDRFGFGEKTGIDLLGESTGIIFSPDKIGQVELATSAFGQGISVTPIQLVNAACATINGGYLNQPTILKGIASSYTNDIIYQSTPITLRQVISKSTSDLMRRALEHVAALGTARSAYIEGYRVGGKTGTAQVAIDGVYSDSHYILSFLGIAPMNDPRLAVYIAVENPKNTIQYGGVVAAPLVKEVLMESFAILNIPRQEGGIPQDVRYWVDQNIYTVDNYIGMEVAKIRPTTKYQFSIQGTGKTVVAQLPEPGEKLIEGGFVILYTN